jgi:hypothetical protein
MGAAGEGSESEQRGEDLESWADELEQWEPEGEDVDDANAAAAEVVDSCPV